MDYGLGWLLTYRLAQRRRCGVCVEVWIVSIIDLIEVFLRWAVERGKSKG